MSAMGNTTADRPPEENAQGASSTEQAKEKVQEKAQQAAGQARGRLGEQVDQRSTQAGEQVGTTAEDVRSVAQQLREQGKDQPAKLAEQAADRADRVADYLKRSDGDRILRDVEDFGRRQPMTIMLGGLAAGFLASRFLKASSARRADEGFQSTARPTVTNGDLRTDVVTPPATGVPHATERPRFDEPLPGAAAPHDTF